MLRVGDSQDLRRLSSSAIDRYSTTAAFDDRDHAKVMPQSDRDIVSSCLYAGKRDQSRARVDPDVGGKAPVCNSCMR
tara:strand:- start:230 stop:460 length:231 start_codon:yes stop_codon:yes gene_type:complete